MDRLISQDRAIVVHSFDPFDGSKKRETVCEPNTQLLDLVPRTGGAMVCMINGEPVARQNWDCVLEGGDYVQFVELPMGGGGSNPLKAILAIALVTVGVLTGNPYIIGAALIFGASMLIPTRPVLPNGGASSPSPTYSISLSGNTPRLGDPIPVPYGRHIIYPDFAGQPYIEYSDNDAFYFALLCVANTGDIVIESTTIDDTPIDNFEEVQKVFVGPTFASSQTLVNAAVVNAPEVANQVLESLRVSGPFAALGPGLTTTRIATDVGFPKGLYFANDDGSLASKTITWKAEAQEIDDLGTSIGSWFTLGNETFTANTNTPQRLTKDYTVPSARYQVRMIRTDTRDENARAGHDIEWIGLRSYDVVAAPLEPTASYLALKIRATAQLSGQSERKVAIVMRRKLPTWNPSTGWSAPVETRSIAWALADAMRSGVYSVAVPDSRIDLETLYDLDQVWSARGDEFNGIMDQSDTLWNALTIIARAGRARPMMRGSVYTFVRDSEQAIPSAMFNMRNIVADSFRIDYAMVTEDSPDVVEVEYFDDVAWSAKRVQATIPGATDTTNVQTISLKGVTKRKQAAREAAYTAAAMAYRRATVVFSTEMEGFLPSFGTLIALSHDVPSWGVSTEVTGSSSSTTFTVAEILTWESGQHYAILADEQGDVHGPYRINPGSTPYELVFVDAPDFTPIYGTDKERTRISIGVGLTFMTYAKVTKIEPKSPTVVQITAVVDDARVYSADAAYLSQFPTARPAYYMASNTPNYNDATLVQKSGLACWGSRADGTVGNGGDAGYYYQ